MIGSETGILLTQPNETRNEQDAPASRVTESATCAPTRILRKRCCRTLPLRPAAAFFQAVDQIGARALQGGINTHGQSGQERKRDRKSEHRQRKTRAAFPSSGRKLAAILGTSGTSCQASSAPENPAMHADQQAFENK